MAGDRSSHRCAGTRGRHRSYRRVQCFLLATYPRGESGSPPAVLARLAVGWGADYAHWRGNLVWQPRSLYLPFGILRHAVALVLLVWGVAGQHVSARRRWWRR